MDAGANLTWSLEGVDAGDFTLIKNSMTGKGELRFRNVPNYEAPADAGVNNDYEVTIKVSDGSLSATRDLTVTVEDVNETPVVSGNGSPSFPEIQFDVDTADLTAADYEIGTYTFTDEEGDTVTWDVSGADAAHFTISTLGVLSFNIEPDFENPDDDGSGNTYVIIVRATDDNAQGGKTGTKTGTFAVTVTVTNVDETPEITTTDPSHTAPSFPEIEYDATTADLIVADYDARDEEDAQNITWSRIGADAADFTIDPNTGVLSFAQRPNFEIPADAGADNEYNVTVRATDTTSPLKTRELGVTVTVTDVNERPDIDEDTVPSYVEVEYDFTGTRPDVHTFTATDYDDMDTFLWSLDGVDKDHLEIDAMNGVLTFKQDADFGRGPLPNFEYPRDDNADGSANTYNITVRATDNHAKSTDYPVTINVTNVNEMPEFTGTPNLAITYNENDITDVSSYAARDEEGGVTWSLTGADASDFSIDSGGTVTFVNTPDYETPTGSQDDGTDIDGNVYTFMVEATDVDSGPSRRKDTRVVTVTVMDLEEAGTITVDYLNPVVGDRVTFTLTDPDGGIDLTPRRSRGSLLLLTGPSSYVCPGGSGRQNKQTTPLGRTSRYVVDEDDTGKEMRVVVTYSDRRGPGKSVD